MIVMKNFFAVCLLLAACGCSSTPRYARHSVILQLDFDKVPAQEVIGKLAVLIRQSNPSAPIVRVEQTPTLVIRPSDLNRLATEMNDLEARYRKSLTTHGEQFVTFRAREISIDDACRIVSTLMGMRVVYTCSEIIFRFGPKKAIFRAYKASPQLIDALKVSPEDKYCLASPPPWREAQMMSVDNGMRILFVGADDEHVQFKRELRKRQHSKAPETTSQCQCLDGNR